MDVDIIGTRREDFERRLQWDESDEEPLKNKTTKIPDILPDSVPEDLPKATPIPTHPKTSKKRQGDDMAQTKKGKRGKKEKTKTIIAEEEGSY